MASLFMLAVIIAVFTVFWQEQSLGVCVMPTTPQVSRLLMSECPAQVKGDILELGSGWGGLALKLAHKYPQNKVIGYEMSLVPYWVSVIRAKFFSSGNLGIVRKNFYAVSFKDTGLVMCYLSNPHMAKLEGKFLQELPAGAQVISSTFHCPSWKPVRTQDVVRLYNAQIFVYEQK
jgi:phospholipid N-methyltransferase